MAYFKRFPEQQANVRACDYPTKRALVRTTLAFIALERNCVSTLVRMIEVA